MRKYNTTGKCIADRHYMVPIDRQVEAAVQLIEDGLYFYPEFIKFLGVLRDMFLKRDKIPTFQSVILAGVYDIKNLKLKIRPEEEHQYNSPWNIAAPFDTDMSPNLSLEKEYGYN